MGILDEDVARVREATNLVAIVSEHVGLRKVGRRFQGLCPFHTEKTASFSVNPELGFYKCFGCGAGGDAITFIREVEHLDFVGAVERLAAKAGIQLRYDDAAIGQERRRKDRLVEAVTAAGEIYHRLLLESEGAGLARRYLRSRGYDGDVARQFKLGYAPDAWDTISRELQQAKFSRDDLVEAGLSYVNSQNRLNDYFKNRAIFPIYDVKGDAVGFGGRTLDNQGPKYKNSPESAVYQKSRVLYGLNWAKGDIVAKGEAIICEGYTDVLAFFLAGVPRAVATCGTALVEDHVRVLRNFSNRLVLAYDADDAGQSAAERIYQWESRYEVRLEVAALPAGKDPADVGLADPVALVSAVDGARPFLQFRLDRLLAAADLGTLEGRAAAATRALALVAEHPADLVRDQYIMLLADRLSIDADRLRKALPAAGGGGAPVPAAPVQRRVQPRDRAEVELLRVAVHEPGLIAERLSGELFGDPLCRKVFEALAGAATFHEALASIEGEPHDLLEQLGVEDLPWGESAEEYARSVLVQVIIAAADRRLQAMVRAGDDRASDLKHLLGQVVEARSGGTWEVADRASMQLLPWVAASGEELR